MEPGPVRRDARIGRPMTNTDTDLTTTPSEGHACTDHS